MVKQIRCIYAFNVILLLLDWFQRIETRAVWDDLQTNLLLLLSLSIWSSKEAFAAVMPNGDTIFRSGSSDAWPNRAKRRATPKPVARSPCKTAHEFSVRHQLNYKSTTSTPFTHQVANRNLLMFIISTQLNYQHRAAAHTLKLDLDLKSASLCSNNLIARC